MISGFGLGSLLSCWMVSVSSATTWRVMRLVPSGDVRRMMVTLCRCSMLNCRWRLCGHAARLHILTDKLDNLIHSGSGAKDGGHAGFLQRLNILFRDGAAQQQQYVIHFVAAQQFGHAWNNGVVRARQDRQADYVHVFLQRGVHYHLGSLPQAGVDHFHAGVAQSASYHFGAAIVAVEPGLGHQHTDFSLSRHAEKRTILTDVWDGLEAGSNRICCVFSESLPLPAVPLLLHVAIEVGPVELDDSFLVLFSRTPLDGTVADVQSADEMTVAPFLGVDLELDV